MADFTHEAVEELRKLIGKQLPNSKLGRVSVQEGYDSNGDPSLFVHIVFQNPPRAAEFHPLRPVLVQFRNWLSASKADERFPYFAVSTVAE